MVTPTLRVVVADDAEGLRALICSRLQADPRFDVVAQAADGLEAVEQVAQHRPDAVLLDLSMPGIDGLEALRRIRRDTPDARVVVLSGFRAGEFAADALALGATAYIEKGIELDRVAAVLAEACDMEPIAQAVHSRADGPPLRTEPGLLRTGPPPEPDVAEPAAEPHASGRAAMIGFAVLVLATVVALTVTQSAARQRRIATFEAEGALTAAVVATVVAEVHDRSAELAPIVLGDAPTTDDAQALADVLDAFGVAVLGPDGTVTAASPGNEAMVGRDLTDQYEHLAAAVRGEEAVTGVIAAAVQDRSVVAIATPLADGRAVSVGFEPSSLELSRPLSSALAQTAALGWIVDASGEVIASIDRDGRTLSAVTADPSVGAILAGEEPLGWQTGSWPIDGTGWRVVVAAEEATLFADVNGALSALPWVLVALVASAGVIALSLADRSRRDARRLVAANRELTITNEDLEQFAYIASHDLQEPLRKVASYCQLLERRYAGVLDDTGRQYIRFAVDGATRMQELITDLLRFSRAGRAEGQNATSVDTTAALRGAVADLQELIVETGAQLSLPDHLPAVVADPTHVRQVFANLLSNALKFHRPGEVPVLHVTGFVENDTVHLAFADQGIGIPPEHYDRVFGLFQRLHDHDSYAGTGIGLAICRRLVERYGGRIWVTGAEGYGSTFHLLLPHDGSETT